MSLRSFPCAWSEQDIAAKHANNIQYRSVLEMTTVPTNFMGTGCGAGDIRRLGQTGADERT